MAAIRICFLTLCLSATLVAGSMELSDIRFRTRIITDAIDADRSYWPDSVYNAAINSAIALIAHYGQAIEADTSFTATKGIARYALPSDFDGAFTVINNGLTSGTLTLQFVPWTAWSKNPDSGPQYSINAGYLYVAPYLETDATLRVNYYATPASQLSADSSTTQLPVYWDELIPVVAREILLVGELPAGADFLSAIITIIRSAKREYLTAPPMTEVGKQ